MRMCVRGNTSRFQSEIREFFTDIPGVLVFVLVLQEWTVLHGGVSASREHRHLIMFDDLFLNPGTFCVR